MILRVYHRAPDTANSLFSRFAAHLAAGHSDSLLRQPQYQGCASHKLVGIAYHVIWNVFGCYAMMQLFTGQFRPTSFASQLLLSLSCDFVVRCARLNLEIESEPVSPY